MPDSTPIPIRPRETVILARDFERLVTWYQTALDFRVLRRFDELPYANLETDGGVAIGIGTGSACTTTALTGGPSEPRTTSPLAGACAWRQERRSALEAERPPMETPMSSTRKSTESSASAPYWQTAPQSLAPVEHGWSAQQL